MSATAAAGVSTSGEGDDIDVQNIKADKIKQLMASDPKFIGRLISQLDKNMHKMMMTKQSKLDQIAADQAAIDEINSTIRTHVQKNLDRLNDDIKTKTALKEHLIKQIDEEFTSIKTLERDAAALISRARHTAGKLMRNTATQRLEEARGFSSTVPTTTLIRTQRKGAV